MDVISHRFSIDVFPYFSLDEIIPYVNNHSYTQKSKVFKDRNNKCNHMNQTVKHE